MPTTAPKTDLLPWLELRGLVGFLGQGDQHGWWDCEFLGETGIEMLAYNFPRTAVGAAIEATGAGAKRLHDSLIGRSGVHHLFRLPPVIEQQIHRMRPPQVESEWRSVLSDPEVALDHLRKLAGDTVDPPEGPVQIGYSSEILSASSLPELAAHYLGAFEREIQCFPYFAEKR